MHEKNIRARGEQQYDPERQQQNDGFLSVSLSYTLVVVPVEAVLRKSRDKPRSPRHAPYDQMKKASSLCLLLLPLYPGFIA